MESGNVVHTYTESYSAIMKKYIIKFTGKVILSVGNPAHKDKYNMISFIMQIPALTL